MNTDNFLSLIPRKTFVKLIPIFKSLNLINQLTWCKKNFKVLKNYILIIILLKWFDFYM